MAVDPSIIVASITFIPATVASLAAWRAVNKSRADQSTGNGQSIGTMVYKIHESQVRHETDPQAHKELHDGEE